jgi:hypothetical protein
MAKHKSVTHLPPPTPTPTPAPAPRLTAQLFVIVGELSAASLCVIGIVTVVSWLLDGHDTSVRAKAARPPVMVQQREPSWVLHCRYDRRFGGEICDPPYRFPPVRRFYTRDGI